MVADLCARLAARVDGRGTKTKGDGVQWHKDHIGTGWRLFAGGFLAYPADSFASCCTLGLAVSSCRKAIEKGPECDFWLKILCFYF